MNTGKTLCKTRKADERAKLEKYPHPGRGDEDVNGVEVEAENCDSEEEAEEA